MRFQCKKCGSRVKYDIRQRKLKCENCGFTYSVNQYENEANAELYYQEYHCRSCGAELLSTEEEQSVFCSYCGEQAFLKEKTDSKDMPQKIIPFRLTKGEIKERYQKMIAKNWFLPKEMKEEAFLEEFRGVYIPYWRTSVEIEPKEFEFKGTKTYTKGNYDYHEDYEMGVKFAGQLHTGYQDASIFFDDTIADSISPYSPGGEVDFKQGYLAGFYADKATVPNDLYLDYSKDLAIGCMEKRLQSASSVNIHAHGWKKELEIHPKAEGITLFPVWFLTWRRNKRVAYAVANGQNGKIVVDLPVDYKEFFQYVGISTVVLFLLLSILPIFVIPLKLAGISGIFMWLSSYILYTELRRIRLMETHRYDYGYTGKKKKALRKGSFLALKIILWGLVFIATCLALYCEVPNDLQDTAELIRLLMIVINGMMLINGIQLKNKFGLVISILGIVGSTVSYHLAALQNPYDYVNYIIAFLYLVILVINALTAMYYFNYLTTRPVPNFFHREGTNHRYEAD